jgi:TonB family protein
MSFLFVKLRSDRRIVLAIALSLLAGFSIVRSGAAENLPDMRPVLIGSEKDALINLIDTKKLIKSGQGDAALMFYCFVHDTGEVGFFEAYRIAPGAERLRDEVKRCLRTARFKPAIYHHRKVPAMVYGTVWFKVIDGRPRLRIFSNQEPSELARESDFIAPQSVYPADHRDDYIANPPGESETGSVELSLSVDASGNLKDVHVVNETPPGAKLGEAAVRVMRQHIYLPAFRSGKPVDSINQIHFTFTHGGGAWR